MRSVAFVVVLVAQIVALLVLCARLARSRRRLPPVEPRADPGFAKSVTVVIPARNEATRIGLCLEGIRLQGPVLAEVLVVDGGSTDGTAEILDAARLVDGRIRPMSEPARPLGYVGRLWAFAAGCGAARGEWIMIVDADVAPQPAMVAGAVAAAQAHSLDAVSFAPRIVAPGAGARWLQSSFLTTLVYRFGPAGVESPPLWGRAHDGSRAEGQRGGVPDKAARR